MQVSVFYDYIFLQLVSYSPLARGVFDGGEGACPPQIVGPTILLGPLSKKNEFKHGKHEKNRKRNPFLLVINAR